MKQRKCRGFGKTNKENSSFQNTKRVLVVNFIPKTQKSPTKLVEFQYRRKLGFGSN